MRQVQLYDKQDGEKSKNRGSMCEGPKASTTKHKRSGVSGARSDWRGRPRPGHACDLEGLVKEETVSCMVPDT